MKNPLRATLTTLVALLCSLSARADYELGTPEQYLAHPALSVIDATVEKVVTNGPVHLSVHELVVGKKAPKILRDLALTCEPGSPAGSCGMKVGKRYLIVTEGENLFEFTTYWEILRSADGELVCHYKQARKSPPVSVRMPDPGLHSLVEFKKQVRAVAAAARKPKAAQ